VWHFIERKFPWSLIFLLGGGFAIADGLKNSGASAWMGMKLKALESLPNELILFIVVVLLELITNFTSNVAIANMFLPIMAEIVSRSTGVKNFFLLFCPSLF
jgi:sodium-dependent dicarboxylate transporter 2/3/5